MTRSTLRVLIVETSLAELLGDDVDRGVGIEEAVADDLAFDLVGADVVASWGRVSGPGGPRLLDL